MGTFENKHHITAGCMIAGMAARHLETRYGTKDDIRALGDRKDIALSGIRKFVREKGGRLELIKRTGKSHRITRIDGLREVKKIRPACPLMAIAVKSWI